MSDLKSIGSDFLLPSLLLQEECVLWAVWTFPTG